MTDSKYFTTTKKGEIFELKSELNSDKKEKKKEAVKKVSWLLYVKGLCVVQDWPHTRVYIWLQIKWLSI